MNTYFLRMRFQTRTGRWVPRVVKCQAESVLHAAHDAEHIINGYILGSGFEAECDSISLSNRGTAIETRDDFSNLRSALNDN